MTDDFGLTILTVYLKKIVLLRTIPQCPVVFQLDYIY